MTKSEFVAKANASHGNGTLLHKVLQSGVRAALAGRQQQPNLEPVMVLARKAALRVLKREMCE